MMSLKPRFLAGVLLPAVVILVFFFLLVFSMLRLVTISEHMRLEAPHNMLWVTSRAEVAGLKLANVVANYPETDKTIRQDLLKQHYDVLVSRLLLFQQGPQQRQIQTMGFASEMAWMESKRPALDTVVHTLLMPGWRTADIERVDTLLQHYNDVLGKMANTSMITEWEQLGGKIEAERGELWIIIISLIVIMLTGATLVGYLVILMLESRKQADELHITQHEIAMHRDHLEELVKKRTKALDAALERLQLSTELYRNFGAMLSHQFRTPLAIIDSSLQRLIRRHDRLLPDEVEVRGNRARDAIQRLVKLIESTLDAARLDAGQVNPKKRQVDIAGLVGAVFQQQEALYENRNLHLISRLTTDRYAFCDPTHIEHILVNLIGNACKYSAPESPVTVELNETSTHITCRVTNEGALDTDSDSIFKRYYRGENAKGYAGVGLGLYMAKMLARLQDGDVVLDTSQPGMVSLLLCLPHCVMAIRPVDEQVGES